MSVPITHASTSTPRALDEEAPKASQWRRQVIGIVGGLALALLAFFLFPASGVDQVNEVAAASAGEDFVPFTDLGLRVVVFAAVLLGVWWMTEAIPLAATALLPLVIFPAFQVASFKEVAAPYASDTIFLFMGGFMLALAMQKWNLHRRIALGVVLLVGAQPRRLVLGFMIATGFVSMWVSNTATAVVMLPIGLSVLNLVAGLVGGIEKVKKFATGLMLGIAYAASIGSVATIIGTPPNALLVATLSENYGIDIGFGQWMLVGAPLAIVFMAFAWWLMVYVLFRPEISEIPGGRELIEGQWKELGRMSRGEVIVAVVFVLAALSWVFVPIVLDFTGSELNISDSLIAMVTAAVLFLIPADVRTGTGSSTGRPRTTSPGTSSSSSAAACPSPRCSPNSDSPSGSASRRRDSAPSRSSSSSPQSRRSSSSSPSSPRTPRRPRPSSRSWAGSPRESASPRTIP